MKTSLLHPNILTDDQPESATSCNQTLQAVLEQLAANAPAYRLKYPRAALLEIFLSVCHAVAFAHSKGVLHRDLKPSNIWLGDFGEVLAGGWGKTETIEEGQRMLDGVLSESPHYIAPEQAEGTAAEIDAQSDVYSLGALLYHLLTLSTPYEEMPHKLLIKRMKDGGFEAPCDRRPDLSIPRELEAICLKAMAHTKGKRYASADWLARDIRNYLGGTDVAAYRTPKLVRFWKNCKRNLIPASIVSGLLIAALLIGISFLGSSHARYRISLEGAFDAKLRGDQLAETYRHVTDKRNALPQNRLKEKTAEEKQLDAELEKLQIAIATQYGMATTFFESIPDLFLPNKRVTDGYFDMMFSRINLALLRKDYPEILQWINATEARGGAKMDPGMAAELDNAKDYLNGLGSLSIDGDESIREVQLYRLYDDKGRIVAGDPIIKGKLPQDLGLDTSSYVIIAEVESVGRFTYPVYVGHSEEKTIYLQAPPPVPDGMAFVPGGEFFMGGAQSPCYREHTYSTEPFFIKQHEVTFAEYIAFWKTLTDEKQQANCIARIRFDAEQPEDIRAWDNNGTLTDERLKPDNPVVGITRAAANAYCQWKSEQTGTTVRLPTAEEWEKAARGVDARTYVWGDGYHPEHDFALTLDNAKGKAKYPFLAPPGSFFRDISIYGIYDMAGNVREYTATPFPNSPFYQIKGASAFTPASFLPCCYASDAPTVPSDIGFRYVQEITAE